MTTESIVKDLLQIVKEQEERISTLEFKVMSPTVMPGPPRHKPVFKHASHTHIIDPSWDKVQELIGSTVSANT